MRKMICRLVILFFVSAIFNSCIKNLDIVPIQVTIKANETYEYNLGGFGDEEGAGIKLQAKHFEISTIERTQNMCIYKYKPSLNYVGQDVVELRSARGSDGRSKNKQILLTLIRFYHHQLIAGQLF